MILLYVDLLGVKARWRRGGRPEAEVAFRHLQHFVTSGLSILPRGRVNTVRGGVDSDAAALIFQELDEAIDVARTI